MRALKEDKVGGYVNTLIERNAPLQNVVDRHFQGTIIAASAPDGNWPFLVNVDRTEGPDETDWLCAVPGYVPRVGDVVECEWRDESSGYIKYPLTFHPLFAQVAQTTGQAIGTGATILDYDTLISDPYGCFDAALINFTCPFSGIYRIGGGYRISTSSEMVLTIFQNGAFARRLFVSGTAGGIMFTGSSSLSCAQGDILQLQATQPLGAQTTVGGVLENFFEVEYLGPR